ncbi:hypothetical protein CP8484711_0422A, partial [Chlamydia psittaci 84-8471/1]
MPSLSCRVHSVITFRL